MYKKKKTKIRKGDSAMKRIIARHASRMKLTDVNRCQSIDRNPLARNSSRRKTLFAECLPFCDPQLLLFKVAPRRTATSDIRDRYAEAAAAALTRDKRSALNDRLRSRVIRVILPRESPRREIETKTRSRCALATSVARALDIFQGNSTRSLVIG